MLLQENWYFQSVINQMDHACDLTIFRQIAFARKMRTRNQTEKTGRYHDIELSITSHVISKWRQKVTFDVIQFVNNNRLKPRTIHQIVRFIFHLSPKLHLKFWKYFGNMPYPKVDSDHYKSRVLHLLAKFYLTSFPKLWGDEQTF